MTKPEKIEDLKAIYDVHRDDIYYNTINDLDIFNEQNKNSLIGSLNRDFQIDEEYKPHNYNEILWSPRNTNPLDAFYVDILLTKLWGTSTYEKTYMKTNENEYSPYSRPDPQPITDDDKFNDDVTKMFNIGEKPYQNSLSYVSKYHRRITIKNIWDRHSIKVNASFVSQTPHNYIGNSHVNFNPIKYFKLNANDDKFWLEFYSARDYKIPIKVPDDDKFSVEMQFLQHKKLLYV